MGTKIEWAEEVWQPIVGCSKCSPGCLNCYAEIMANRQAGMALKKNPIPDVTRGQGRYVSVISGGKWNGSTAIDDNSDGSSEMDKPLGIKKPTRFFVCSMGDLFHETVSSRERDPIFKIMEECPQHTFLLLTKRADKMWEDASRYGVGCYPKNIWYGVTVCNQQEADAKIPILLRIPAAVKFLSIEPMLGPVDLDRGGFTFLERRKSPSGKVYEKLDWVICGGESGHGARPMHPDWVRSLRDQCKTAGVPFLFKQWGEWGPWGMWSATKEPKKLIAVDRKGNCSKEYNTSDIGTTAMGLFGKKKTGRTIDEVIHDEYPAIKNG